VDAQWCTKEGESEKPSIDSNWDGGVSLNDPFILQDVPLIEWAEANSVHRQYHPLSFCRNSLRLKNYHIKNWE